MFNVLRNFRYNWVFGFNDFINLLGLIILFNKEIGRGLIILYILMFLYFLFCLIVILFDGVNWFGYKRWIWCLFCICLSIKLREYFVSLLFL